MKQYSYPFTLIYLIAIITTSLFGCADDSLNNKFKNQVLETDILFQVQTPNTTPPKTLTKSEQTAAETYINEIEVLVFENEKYAYRAEGFSIINDGINSTTFKARIKSSKEPTTLYIIANADDIILSNEVQIGESITDIKTRLNKNIEPVGINGYLPMWGNYDLPSGINASQNNNFTGIKMLRSMARIDILNISATPFILASVQAYNVASGMQLIPNNPTLTPSVTEPSIPSWATYSIQTDPVSTTSKVSSVGQIYLPEAVAPSADAFMSATCLVIGGYYNNSSSLSYYRLDINPGINGHPFGQILRNYRYEFNLTRITKEGYPTPDEAVKNISSGINSNIVLWKDFIHSIVFNSDIYFGISTNYIVLPGKEGSLVTLLTETDMPDYSICWANAQGVPLDIPSTTNIKNDYFLVEKSPDGSTINITTLQTNPIGSSTRNIRYVLVQIKDLRMLLTLLQEPDEFNPGNVTWANTNVDEPGTFAARIQDPGMFYQWNRRKGWPATGDVTGWDSQGADGNVWEDVTDPCPTGWRVPSSKELTALLKDSPGRKWRSIYSGYEISGMWFAPTQEEAEAATFDNPGNAFFMPAAGGRHTGGSLFNQESNGQYWADNLDQGGTPYILSLVDGTSGIWPAEGRAAGSTIRCVKANN